MRKQFLAFLMVLMMVPTLLTGNVAFAADKDVIISDYSANGGDTIDRGGSFYLLIKIKNRKDEAIENVSIEFNSAASFQPSDSVYIKEFSPVIGAGAEEEAVFEFIYTGGTDKDLPVVIHYKDEEGNPHVKADNIFIRNANSESSSGGGGGGGFDKETIRPNLVIGSKAIPEGNAGSKISIPLTITNMSNYEARNIKITPQLPDGIFVIDQMMLDKTIGSIPAKKADNIVFQFDISRDAKAGTYKVPLTIDYTNVYGVVFPTETVEIYIRISNTNHPPELVVREARSSLREIPEEQDFTVTFEVWNMGTIEAKNVTIELTADSEHFYILDSLTKQYLHELKGLQSKEISYSLKTKKGMQSGTYGITLLMTHDSAEKPATYTMYVNVLGTEEEEEEEKDDIDIITENIITPQEAVLAEHPFTTSFTIKNTGTTSAKGVKVSVESGNTILPRSLNMLNIPEIKPGEAIPVAFSFMATKESESRSYSIKAVIEYRNNDESVRKEQYMGVLIENPEEEEEEEDKTLNTVPKIIISEYSTEPVMVNAGENFTLRMKFLNTNKIKAVQNMKITLVINEGSEETGSVFSPVQSSNTFYIDHLDPGKASEKEMVMYTIPDAKAKTYVVKAIFEYEYEDNDQLKTNNMEDLFGIPVVQPAKLETTEVIVLEPAIVGEPVYLTSEFYNMGKVSLTNLMIKAEGDFDTKESNYFVGNFEMGSSDYYEAPITPLRPGETKGILVFTFEDSAGQAHRIEKEFTVNAMEASPVMNPGFPGGMDPGMMDPGMMDPGMEGMNGSRIPIVPISIGAGVVVLIVVFIIVRKKRKKRKEMMLDEDI
jgi:hypothetical protein